MIIVIDSGPQFRREIDSLYKNSDEKVVGISAFAGLEDALNNHPAEVVILGPTIPVQESIKQAGHISASYPEISVVMAVDELDPNVLREAMRAGVKDVIVRGASDEQMAAAISQGLVAARRLKESLDTKSDGAGEEMEEPDSGKIITFFSTKGGVGKSVVSTNVAVALAGMTGKRVVVLDLDLQFGDVAIMLQMTPEHTIYDMIQMMSRLDSDMLQGFLSVHTSGVKALLAPVRPHESDSITVDQINGIIDLLRYNFDYVIIDTPPTFSDVVLAALDRSDQIYLIATMDMPCIKNIKLAIQTLKQLGYPTDSIKFILNRADSKVWLEIDEVEKSLGIKAEAKIPSDRLVPRCVNKGVPIVSEQPKSQVSKSLLGLAEKIRDTDAKLKKKPDEPQNHGIRRLVRRLS